MNEIIIDDVNVVECEFFDNKEDECLIRGLGKKHIMMFNCKHNPNCYFKQLKRLEVKHGEAVHKMTEADVEIEKLQAENENILKIVDNKNETISTLELENEQSKEFIRISKRLLNQGEFNFEEVVNLRSENEKLKKRNKLYKKVIVENQQKSNNKVMILKACIKGEINVDDFKNYAKLELENKKLKQKNKELKGG